MSCHILQSECLFLFCAQPGKNSFSIHFIQLLTKIESDIDQLQNVPPILQVPHVLNGIVSKIFFMPETKLLTLRWRSSGQSATIDIIAIVVPLDRNQCIRSYRKYSIRVCQKRRDTCVCREIQTILDRLSASGTKR